MSGYRFRLEGSLLVLQVYEPPKTGMYEYNREGTWRDAAIADIPVADPFRREPVTREPITISGPVGLDISEHFR